MPRLLGRAGLAIGFVAALLTATPLVARACSGEEPYDPNRAVAIAEGWVTGVRLRPDLASRADGPVPTEVTLRVARVMWGGAPDTIVFVDYGSAYRMPDGTTRFAGGAGACGILDDDPSGKYALLVFSQGRDGRLAVHRIQGAAFGDGPNAPQVEQFRQYLTVRLRPRAMPRAGEGATLLPLASSGLAQAAVTVGMLAAGALLLAARRAAHRGGPRAR